MAWFWWIIWVFLDHLKYWLFLICITIDSTQILIHLRRNRTHPSIHLLKLITRQKRTRPKTLIPHLINDPNILLFLIIPPLLLLLPSVLFLINKLPIIFFITVTTNLIIKIIQINLTFLIYYILCFICISWCVDDQPCVNFVLYELF